MGSIVERKNPSGKTVYGIRYTDELGHDVKQFSQRWNRRTAQAALDEIEEPSDSASQPRQSMTVEQLFEEWHQSHIQDNCSQSWIEDTASNYRLRIGPMIGHRTIGTVNKRLVRNMVAELRKVAHTKHPGQPHAGHRTINKTLSVLKGMFSYAVEIDQLPVNPVHGVPELPETPTRRIDAWPMEAVHAVALEAAQYGAELPEYQKAQRAPWVNQRNYTLIALASLTGLRQSELLGLRWEQVDGLWLHVTYKLCRRSFVRRETKSKRGHRRVPLMPHAAALLDAWRALGAHPEIVFPNQTGDDYMRADFDNKVWRKSRKRAGEIQAGDKTYDCAAMTFHELRHTFISRCLAAGRDVWEVAHWAGDDPDLIKKVYGHYIPDSLGDTTRLAAALSIPIPVPLALPQAGEPMAP